MDIDITFYGDEAGNLTDDQKKLIDIYFWNLGGKEFFSSDVYVGSKRNEVRSVAFNFCSDSVRFTLDESKILWLKDQLHRIKEVDFSSSSVWLAIDEFNKIVWASAEHSEQQRQRIEKEKEEISSHREAAKQAEIDKQKKERQGKEEAERLVNEALKYKRIAEEKADVAAKKIAAKPKRKKLIDVDALIRGR
ncbi:hypothetical protein [Colwellia piezophila]|uniref:hypothetical protein n=1 Tax=Colwellia piezophila TaxID=211668 RepID=UPI00037CBB9E|nr:hypothetical protein [Colwellia piezophila]